MANLGQLTKTRAIVNEMLQLTEETRVYFANLENLVPRNGSGSPEGVVEADVGASYYDLTAIAGARHYIKIEPDILGDRAKGWQLA